MASVEVGGRCFAVRDHDEEKLYIYGRGVYRGDLVPKGFGGMMKTNPCIQLDNGSLVWGFQCWWGPEEQLEAIAAGREIVGVALEQEVPIATERGLLAIWKYPLVFTFDEQVIEVQDPDALLKVDLQEAAPTAWFIVDPTSSEKRKISFFIRGTGKPLGEAGEAKYVATCQEEEYVWHVFMKYGEKVGEVSEQ